MDVLAVLYSLTYDTAMSWMRMLIALAASMSIGLALGIMAATSKRIERVLIPILDILQTLPILAFFPFVIYIVVATLPGYIGINAAVIILIITSMLWNIAFGVYQVIKTLPAEFLEMSKIFNISGINMLRKVYIPASLPVMVEQSMLSWAIGLFYLVTSEIFSTGSANYAVKYGIGVALTNLAFSGNTFAYALGILVFICFVVVTRFTLFSYMERRFKRHISGYKKVGNVSRRVSKIFAPLFLAVNMQVRSGAKSIERGNAKSANLVAIKKAQKPAKDSNNNKKLGNKYAIYAIFALAIIIYAYFNRGIAYDEYNILVATMFSLARIWLAFAAIVIITIPISIYLIYISKRSSSYLTLFQILASIPATILLPIIVIALKGNGNMVAFAVFFISGIWYMIFSMFAMKSQISQSVFEVKSIFGVKGWRAWKEIYLLSILPGFITGGVTAIAAEWNASIVAERFTSTVIGNGNVITEVNIGLGKLLDVSLANNNIFIMVLGLINLTIVIILINRLFWKRLYNRVESVYK